MNASRRILFSVIPFLLLAAWLPVSSAAASDWANAAPGRERIASFGDSDAGRELCGGFGSGEPGVGQRMARGLEQIRGGEPAKNVIASTFIAHPAMDRQATLAGAIAATAISAAVQANEGGMPVSADAGDVLCLAVLMRYDAVLRVRPDVPATEIFLLAVAGAVFRDIFDLMEKGKALSNPATAGQEQPLNPAAPPPAGPPAPPA